MRVEACAGSPFGKIVNILEHKTDKDTSMTEGIN